MQGDPTVPTAKHVGERNSPKIKTSHIHHIDRPTISKKRGNHDKVVGKYTPPGQIKGTWVDAH